MALSGFMNDGWRNDILFFSDENPEELKAEFIRLSARYSANQFSAFEIAQYVFQYKKDPMARAGKAAEVWARDLDVQERIRIAIIKGPEDFDDSEEALRQRLLSIADNPKTCAADRIKAIEAAAKMKEGAIKAPLERLSQGAGNNAELLVHMAKLLPV